MNAINLIRPFRYEGMWVFDDPRVGLDKEPFVSGADTMIDVFVADIPNAENGFRLLFSATPFPGYTAKLEWRREEYGGNWYFSPEFKMEGWLCPALFKYFDKAPKEIYVKAEPRPDLSNWPVPLAVRSGPMLSIPGSRVFIVRRLLLAKPIRFLAQTGSGPVRHAE